MGAPRGAKTRLHVAASSPLVGGILGFSYPKNNLSAFSARCAIVVLSLWSRNESMVKPKSKRAEMLPKVANFQFWSKVKEVKTESKNQVKGSMWCCGRLQQALTAR